MFPYLRICVYAALKKLLLLVLRATIPIEYFLVKVQMKTKSWQSYFWSYSEVYFSLDVSSHFGKISDLSY